MVTGTERFELVVSGATYGLADISRELGVDELHGVHPWVTLVRLRETGGGRSGSGGGGSSLRDLRGLNVLRISSSQKNRQGGENCCGLHS